VQIRTCSGLERHVRTVVGQQFDVESAYPLVTRVNSVSQKRRPQRRCDRTGGVATDDRHRSDGISRNLGGDIGLFEKAENPSNSENFGPDSSIAHQGQYPDGCPSRTDRCTSCRLGGGMDLDLIGIANQEPGNRSDAIPGVCRIVELDLFVERPAAP